MNALDVARRLASCFDEDHIRYGIGGALALGIWGAPRATKDVDVTVFVPESELSRVIDTLERAGVMVDRLSAAKDVSRIGMFKGRLGVTFVDVFMLGHPQYEAMQARLQSVADEHGTLSVISPEDLMIHKLVFGRGKDTTDLERLLAVRPTMDITYVRSWLVQMVPAGDKRLEVLDDLERRFAAPT